MNTRKTFFLIAVFITLITAFFLTSCLKSGDETIILEGQKKPASEPSEPPEPKYNDEVDQSDLQGESGELRFNLQWNTEDDLDLVVITPCGEEIFFDNREVVCNGSIGKLDIDANFEVFPENPQENIYWEKPSAGHYEVYVVNSSYKETEIKSIDFTLTVIYLNKRIDLEGHTNGYNDELFYSIDVTE
ncbi:MAG: hypothetical protein II956_10020 [Bacteroidales bacterium]|nr:hypothetical protein [Bacteroidales bacterium]